MTTHTAITDYYAGATLDNGSLLCHRTTDATVYTASATSELNSGGGVYSAVFANVAAGSYRLKLKSGGEVVATRDVTFAGTNNETVQTGVRAELDSASRAAILTQEIVESYPADAAAPTLAQAVMLTLQHLQQKSVSGTTVTIKKLDKTTTAATYTLDSATDPTSITRAT